MTQDTQEPNTLTSNKLSTRQIFTFEWDNILRVIGVITGITGVTAALLYILGYIQVAGTLDSLGISQGHYWVSLSNEFYLLSGVIPFLEFILNIASLLIFYLIARAIIQTVGRDILIKIKNPFIALSIGAILGAIFIYIGISRGDTEIKIADSYFYILVFVGIDILATTFEIVFFRNDKKQTLTRYYNLVISTYSIIKVIVLGSIIYILLINGTSSQKSQNYSSCFYLTESPISATIHSVRSLGLDGETRSADSYTYVGYYLLYIDNNYYYLFKELDSDKLKPKSISVLKKDAVEMIQLDSNAPPPNWNLTKTCSELYGH